MKKQSESTEKRKVVKGVKINISEVARSQGISWNTAKRRVEKIPRKKREKKKKTVLSDYIDIILDKLKKFNCSAISLYYFLQEKGYTGSYSTLKKYVSKQRTHLKKQAVIRVETTPGLQGQIDWKESMVLESRNHEKYKVNIFLYVLSYSKYKYIELTVDRIQPTLFNCMVNAFKACGGVPDEIWFDNMKTVVDSHDINTGEVTFNSKFLEFSKNCQFKPIACRPFRPCTKGIAENLAKIMERLRVYNEEFDDYEDLDEIVKKLNRKLNEEESQATGCVCKELFETKEKEYLTKINFDQFKAPENLAVRKVSNESMINYEKCKYSVPTSYLGQLVQIEEINGQLHIYYSGKEIACHKVSNKKYNYRANDLNEILESSFPNDDGETRNQRIDQRLKGYDVLLRRQATNE